MTNTNVAVRQPKNLKEYMEGRKVEISSMLPSHINYERFAKSAQLAVVRNPQLQECTLMSLFAAVINAAELGLDFVPARGHAYLVKFGKDAVFMPGYRGLIDLAKRTGDVTKIEAHLVCENDAFTLEYGTESKLIHVPEIRKERGKLIGVYAVAHFKDGTYQFEYMTTSEINAIRQRSKAANNGPWVTDYTEMARKTVVRRLFKYLPSSSDLLDKAIEADNKVVGFADFEVEPMENGEKTSKLADKLQQKMATPAPEPEQGDEDVDLPDATTTEPEPPKRKRGRPAAKKQESKVDAPPDYKKLLTDAQYSEVAIIEAKEALDIRQLYNDKLTQEQAQSIVEWLERKQ